MLDVTIDEIGAKGDGVAAVDGEALYIPYTAPGDTVRVEAGGKFGFVQKVLNPSMHRRSPDCPLYAKCGGCALQHVTRDFYRNWKRTQIENALVSAKVVCESLAETVWLPPATRRRAQFYVERRDREMGLGFYQRRSRKLVNVGACPILHPALNAALPALRGIAENTPGEWASFSMAVTLCDNGLDLDFASQRDLAEPTPQEIARLSAVLRSADVVRASINGEVFLTLSPPIVGVSGIEVTPPAGGFLQASSEGQAALIDLVVPAAGKAKKVADLFSGCGTFSLPLARTASVASFDTDLPSISALKQAAASNQSDGLRPVNAQARNLFERPLMAAELNAFDAIVLDPPRAGAIHQAREIAKSKVRRIISVSCNPKSFARDAKIICDGGYRLTQVTPVDQFVYSPHIELVGVFDRE